MYSKGPIRYRKLDDNDLSIQKLNLLISGFGLQQIVPVDDVIDAICRLPAKHIKKLKVIKFDPNKNISFLFRHQRQISQLGEYLLSHDAVVIYRFYSYDECFHVLFHEIGHHIYFKFLSSQQKKQWVTQVYRSEKGISKLGERNACEDFAECYAFYLTQPSSLRLLADKYKFISELFK